MHERDKFELLLNRIGYTRRMTLKGVSGKWSIKDILAHILAYEQYIADRMNEILHGETYVPCKTQNALDAFLDEFGYPDFGSPLLDDDGPNAWVTEKVSKRLSGRCDRSGTSGALHPSLPPLKKCLKIC